MNRFQRSLFHQCAWLILAPGNFFWLANCPGQEAGEKERPRLVVQVGHRSEVTAMAASADGKMLATGDADGRVFLWDAATGRQLRELKTPLPQSAVDTSGQHWASLNAYVVTAVGFSPDGAFVAAGVRTRSQGEATLHLWNTESGRLISQVVDDMSSPWAFDQESRRLVAGNQLFAFDPKKGAFAEPQPLVERTFARDSVVLSWHLGKEWSAQGDQAGGIVGYDTETFQPQFRLKLSTAGELQQLDADDSKQGDGVTALQQDAKGRLLFGSRCGRVGCYDVAEQTTLWVATVRDPVERITASPDGKSILVQTQHRFYLVSADTGQEVFQRDRNREVLSAAFSPDDGLVVTGHGDGVVRLWNARTGTVVRRYRGAFGAVNEVALVDRGQHLAAFDSYGVLSLWKQATGELVSQFDVPKYFDRVEHADADGVEPVPVPSIAPDEVFQETYGGEPYGLGLEPYRRSHRASWGYAGAPSGIFCNQGKTLLFCGRSGSSSRGALDVLTGKKLAGPPVEFRPTNVLAVSSDGKFVVADKMSEPDADGSSFNSEYWLAALESGRYLNKLADRGYFVGPTLAAISRDNVWTAMDDGGDTVRILGSSNGREYAKVPAISPLSLAFSPRADRLAISEPGGKVQVWDRAGGKLVRSLPGHHRDVTCVLYSADGQTFLTASADETARLWNANSGELKHVLQDGEATLAGIEFSPTGELMLVQRDGDCLTRQSPDHPKAKVLRVAQEKQRVEGVCPVGNEGTLLVYSRALGESTDQSPNLAIRSLVQERPARWLQNSSKSATTFGHLASFDADGKGLVTVSSAGVVRRWGRRGMTGRLKLEEFGGTLPGTDWEFSGDRRFVSAVQAFTANPKVRAWELESGKMVDPDAPFLGEAILVPPDFPLAFEMSEEGGGLRILDTKSRKLLKDLTDVDAVDLSLDRTRLVTAHRSGTVQVWEIPSLKLLQEFQVRKGRQALERDKNSKGNGLLDLLILLGEALGGNEPDPKADPPAEPEKEKPPEKPDGAAEGKKPDETKEPLADDPTATHVQHVKFSPLAKYVLTFDGNTHKLWDVATGVEQSELQWPEINLAPEEKQADVADAPKLNVYSVEFSADERWLVGGPPPTLFESPQQGFLVVWDAQTGKTERVLRAVTSSRSAPTFSNDGRLILQSGADDAIYLWRWREEELACRLVLIDDNNWVVADPAGRFDASQDDEVDGLHWVVRNEPIDLDQLKDRYSEPNLLAKVLGLDDEPLRDVKPFGDVKLFPAVELIASDESRHQFSVRLTNRGGGLGRVVIRINGKELTADARGPVPNPHAAQLELPLIDLSDDPRIIPGERNTLEVLAYNAEGNLRSRGLDLSFDGDDEPIDPVRLWAIVAGVSDYRGEAIDLRYAAKDADDFSLALRMGAERLFGPENVRITTLTGSQSDLARRASRENLLAAFAAARGASAHDILVIYLAGHGVNEGGPDGEFYYLCSDAASTDLADEELRRLSAVSSREVTGLINNAPPAKQVMILDTCAAGRLLEKLSQNRDIPSSQKLALRRVKERTGTFLLAGCAADRVSYETSRYAQGLLTYSLLFGMRGPALREGEFVDVGRLFSFVEDRVPELAANVGGVQSPIVARPKAGGSFDLGWLVAQDKSRIPLQIARPVIWPANFQAEEGVEDELELSEKVDGALKAAASRGREARFVFDKTRDFAGAFRLTGRYKQNQTTVKVAVVLSEKGKVHSRFEVAGSREDLDALAAKIVQQAVDQLREP